MGSTGGVDSFDKMAKNCMKITKLAFLSHSCWGSYMGGQANFSGSGGAPVPPLGKPVDDLKYFIENGQSKPKVIGISKCRLRTNRTVLSNIDLKDSYKWTPTEASKGRTLIYIDNKLKYKLRNDLKLYKEKQIEPTFLGIIEPNLKNKIVGCIYKHLNVPITEFTNDYMGLLLEELSCEKKYFNG